MYFFFGFLFLDLVDPFRSNNILDGYKRSSFGFYLRAVFYPYTDCVRVKFSPT